MFSEGIYAYLSADGGMRSVLGTPSERTDKRTGVFPMEAPGQPSLPYVVYYEDGASPIYSLAGQNRLQSKRLRFSCYGKTAKDGKVLARQVRIALNNIPVGTLPAGSAEAHGQFYVSEFDGAEPDAHETIYGTHVDFEFWFIDTDSGA
jgi:Protein of unknown function (DUF3168)